MTYWLLALTSVQLSNDYLTGYFISGFVDLPPALISVFLFCFALLIAEMIPTSVCTMESLFFSVKRVQ